ncbi:MBL fold metallo-hydrolase [Porifericola rhodea]|uniref:MBL fold metallo-hydrolase n=1 Tax=Porifericola rhodea TaxID=930972 RepID=UPI002665447C|nr:MBL fold metallo-hydrolase [Porifericola rhodea]WKN31843.1 MBL fold metallo-hydrolase [Porifericola rhodea]
MRIHHFRNASMLLDAGKHQILIDPMLGPKGSMPTFTFFRFKAQKNPIVPFPEGARPLLNRVTHCLITHLHPDHLDAEGEQFLRERQIPVYCSVKDESALRKKGLHVVQTIDYWKKSDFLGGKIEGIPARHGYGFIAKPMGNVMGYYLELPEQPSLYLSADTIYTEAVKKVLSDYQPKLSVVACGSARLDVFKPLLMTVEDIVRFVRDAPHQVLANHLEALNHCPTSRQQLKQRLEQEGLVSKVYIPADGESISLA